MAFELTLRDFGFFISRFSQGASYSSFLINERDSEQVGLGTLVDHQPGWP